MEGSSKSSSILDAKGLSLLMRLAKAAKCCGAFEYNSKEHGFGLATFTFDRLLPLFFLG